MSTRIDSVPAATGRDWPTGVTLAALVVAFGVVAGPLGLLAGLVTALVGYVLGPPYALAAGHVALVAVVPEGSALSVVVLVEAAFVLVLLVPLRRGASPGRTALVAVTSALVLAGAAWLVLDTQSIGLAATAVLVLLGIGAYGLHRFELVRLGLVPGSDDGDASTPLETEPTAGSSAETTTEPATDP
ncbi:hypothetical protein [Natrinema sp. DC36]|uniref:hypothetical protein n=1 Tax=Natrinema sp. DC36 TaxID=2878680 RepID=UPI001CEFFA2C|nr:hypothetical protein [Natrinema sp. DC36]